MAWLHLSENTQNAIADTLAAQFDAGATDPGYVELYDGTPPATAETAVSTQNLLVTCVFSDPAFVSAGSVTPGVAEANTIASGTAVYTGDATWARFYDGDDAVIGDGDVGLTDATVLLAESVHIESSASVSITVGSLTVPSGVA